jgi:hypothetical protein
LFLTNPFAGKFYLNFEIQQGQSRFALQGQIVKLKWPVSDKASFAFADS